MPVKAFAAWLMLIAALAAPGCGFQLRGSAELPDHIGVIYVQAPAVLADELLLSLQAGGAKTTPRRVDADTVLAVESERFDRRVLSVDSRTGKAREFELAYSSVFRIERTSGPMLVAPQTVRLRRDFVFDEDAVIGKSREEDVLRREMRRDAAQQILRRMQAALDR